MNRNIAILILVIGVIFRLFLTAHGNFLFNIDNARDFVDIREIVELHKLRLTGPTSAIEGFYNGPLWYYLLAIPYIISHGDPYSAIILEIILWVIGGIFLFKILREINSWLFIPIGLVWVASNYIVLTNLYSFNPNPVTLLAPVFIYSLFKYLKGERLWIVVSWLLAGAFFNFEMNIGIFTPIIILITILLLDKSKFKDKFFLIGILIFVIFLLPQFLFDLKHNFLMTKSITKFLSENKGELSPLIRMQRLLDNYSQVINGTLMNSKLLTVSFLILFLILIKNLFKSSRKNIILAISLIFIFTQFLGYLIIPVAVNTWHLGGFAVASLILIAAMLFEIWKINLLGKSISVVLTTFLIFYSVGNILNFFINDFGKPSQDPSVYRNEIAAIDYVYQNAQGKNFKVYTYLPSVYDYPYQYLIWWHGLKEYGYLPQDYAYAPNKPNYIPSKEKFSAKSEDLIKRVNSNLVYLIKEPDRNYTRPGWEGQFINLKEVSKIIVGPIEIETKKEN